MTNNLNDEDLIIINDDEVITKNQNNDNMNQNPHIKSLNKPKIIENIGENVNRLKNINQFEKKESHIQSSTNINNNDSNDENDGNLNVDVICTKKSKIKNGSKKSISENKKNSDTNKFANGVFENQETIKFNVDAGLESAAFSSRLPYDKMTTEEVNLFQDIVDAEGTLNNNKQIESYKIFLFIRNKILQIWLDNPKVQLVVEEIMNKLQHYVKIKNEKVLILRIYKYLERYSYINFGVFKRILPLPTPTKGKIIIVGAGIAGLMSARQLKEFGFEVVIYEARDRIGGRIATFRKGPFIADLGAMVVTGLGGNPIAILSKQISMELAKIKQKCPLYDNSGKIIQKDRDETLEKEFNKLLEATSYLTHNLDFDHKIENKPMSLGYALELLIKLQEKHIKKKQVDYYTKLVELQSKFKQSAEKLMQLKEEVKSLSYEYEKLKSRIKKPLDKCDSIEEFSLKSCHRDLRLVCQVEFNDLTTSLEEIQKKILIIEENPSCDTYLNVSDRQVLDWHLANLEFANATPLSDLSLKYWDQDDEFEFTGSHMTVKNGYSCLPIALSEGLNIKLSSAINKIKYNERGVEIDIEPTNPSLTLNNKKKNNNHETDSADAVLVTIPLGCLKEKAVDMFDPRLPEWKLNAIKRLGFGNLNKIVLCFDKVFWDPHINLFGQVPLSTASRGELFLFWNLYKAPVLLSLVAGEAASIMENISDDIIIGRCLAVLRSIFGNSQVPQPKEAVVTRWKSDPWTRGSYSFVSVDSNGSDYDELAEPIVPSSATGSIQIPRIFFAGEHTNKNYPATVHGALLSGLREARKIADIFLGSALSNP